MDKKLKLTESIYILKESEDIYSTIYTSIRKVKKFRVDNLVKEVIEELKNPRNEKYLFDKLSKKYPKKDISDCINALEHEGILSKYDDSDINEKYSKQVLFINELTNSWEESIRLQRKIESSKIAVFGIGGIGTWIVNGLSQIGVGEIRIVDPDKVSISNLNRQLFFNEKDIGKYKVDVIESKLPDINIISYKKFISKEQNLEKIIKGVDFIVNCADSPSIEETSRIINNYSERYNIPYAISGGYNLHLGMVGPIIIPGKTATFNDFLNYQKKDDPFSKLEKIKDIEQTGNLGPIAGTIANLQVMEILKYLIGKGEINLNKFAEIDFMNLNVKWIDFSEIASPKNI
jgi:molybdopterin/thiamine biosynthesis adenylyltransferase